MMNQENEHTNNGESGAPRAAAGNRKGWASSLVWGAAFTLCGAGLFLAMVILRALFGRAHWAVLFSASHVGWATAAAVAVSAMSLLVILLAGVRRGRWVELGVAASLVFFPAMTIWYPVAFPESLAGRVPDDTSVLAVVDVIDVIGLNNDYIHALGKSRLLDEYNRVSKGMDFHLDLVKTSRRLGTLSVGWMTRETLFIGGDVINNSDDFAMLIGSYNPGLAEKNFPRILRFMQSSLADALKKGYPDEAREVSREKLDFTTVKYKGMRLHCLKDEHGKTPGPKESNMCWASAPRALVVAGNQAYLKKVLNSLASKTRTPAQKQLVEIQKKSSAQRRPLYVYVDGRLFENELLDILQGFQEPLEYDEQDLIVDGKGAGSDDSRKQLREVEALRGLEYRFTSQGLGTRHEFSVLLDHKRVSHTEFVKYLDRFESRAARMDEVIDHDKALLYFSMSNISTALKSFYELDRDSFNEACGEMGIQAGDLLDVVGDEMGVALLDAKFNKNRNMPVTLDMILALELNPTEKDGKTAARMAAGINAWLSSNSELSLEKREDDLYIYSIPELGKTMKPTMAVTDKHLFVGMNPDTVRRHMKGPQGKATTVKSVARLQVNPSRIADTARDYYDHLKDLQKMFDMNSDDVRDARRGLETTIRALEAQGATSILLDINDEKVSVIVEQTIHGSKLQRIPIRTLGDMMLDMYTEQKQRDKFSGCMNALREAQWGVSFYQSTNGNLDGVNAPVDVCRALDEDDDIQDCRKHMTTDVAEACVPKTFNLKILSDTDYELTAKSPDDKGCWICITEYGALPYSNDGCEAGRKPECSHDSQDFQDDKMEPWDESETISD